MGKNLKNSNSLIVPFWYSLWYSLPWCRALSWQRTCTNYLPGCLPFIPTTCWGGGLKGGGGRFQIDKRIVCTLPSPPSLCNELPICADSCPLFINLCVSIFVNFFSKVNICPRNTQVWLEFVQCYQKGNLQIPQSHNHTWSSCQLQRAHIWISILLQQMSHI